MRAVIGAEAIACDFRLYLDPFSDLGTLFTTQGYCVLLVFGTGVKRSSPPFRPFPPFLMLLTSYSASPFMPGLPRLLRTIVNG